MRRSKPRAISLGSLVNAAEAVGEVGFGDAIGARDLDHAAGEAAVFGEAVREGAADAEHSSSGLDAHGHGESVELVILIDRASYL